MTKAEFYNALAARLANDNGVLDVQITAGDQTTHRGQAGLDITPHGLLITFHPADGGVAGTVMLFDE